MRLKTLVTKKWIFIILLIIVILPPIIDLSIIRQQTPVIVESALHSKKCIKCRPNGWNDEELDGCK